MLHLMSKRFVTFAACGALALATSTLNPTSAFAQDYSSNYQTSGCPNSYDSQFVHAETKNFEVYICGGDLPHTYVGIDNNTGKSITLPLRESGDNHTFVAVNGYYRYILTRNWLTVTENGRVVVRQRARWVY